MSYDEKKNENIEIMQETLVYLTDMMGSLQDKVNKIADVVSNLSYKPESVPKYVPNPAYQQVVSQPVPALHPTFPAYQQVVTSTNDEIIKQINALLAQVQHEQVPNKVEPPKEFCQFVPPISTGNKCGCLNPLLVKPESHETTIPGAMKCARCDVIYYHSR